MQRTRSLPAVVGVVVVGVFGACTEAADDGRDTDAPLTPDSPRGEGDPAACDPGATTLHRLNRTEYDRTVKDLLGVATTPASTFPLDDTGSGFDNNADVLSTSPLLVEKLDAAAQSIAAVVFPDVVAGSTGGSGAVAHVEAEGLAGDVGAAQGSSWNLWSTGTLTASFSTTGEGRYAVRVAADQQAAGPDPAQMSVLVDGSVVVVVDVTGPGVYGGEVDLGAGDHSVSARFENDFYEPDNNADRNLLVDFFELEGPLGASPSPTTGSPGRDRFVACDVADAACVRTSLTKMLTLAFRRPVSDEEVAPYVGLVDVARAEGESVDAGLRLATEAMLLSPNFLFRAEFDDDGAAHRVSPYELASRLSYFFWASMPDEVLFAKAQDGSLERRDVLSAEVDRLLADPKAEGGVIEALSSQWLNTRALDNAHPDPAQYPLPDALRAAMKTETKLTVDALLRADRSTKDLLDVEFTFVNADLAAFYGFDNVDFSADENDDHPGDGFVEVSLAGSNRSGVLTQGAYLASTSYPFRTSPVKRGRWVVDQLLCMPPGEVPPGVPAFNEDEAGGSVRERMEAHRADPACAACHAMMDPIGFGLESFDPIGRARTVDAAGFAIDDDDVFFDTAFTDPHGLAQALKNEATLAPCISERLSDYGLGRGLDFLDDGDVCTIDDVTGRAEARGFGLKTLLHTITEADAFQMRRPGANDSTTTTGGN